MHAQLHCYVPKLVFFSVDALWKDPIENLQLIRFLKS